MTTLTTRDTTHEEQVAREWVRTDPQAIRQDIARLGLDEAVEYQRALMSNCIHSGDARWKGCSRRAIRLALSEIQSEQEG